MRFLVFMLLLSPCAFCGNLKIDPNRGYVQELEELNKYTQKFKESGKYIHSSSRSLGINQEEITLKVYTQTDPHGTEIPLTDAKNITRTSSFKTELETVFYVHGWLDTIESEGCTITKEALLKVANINVIIVNWDECATSIDYFVSQRCVPEVGKYLGQFIETVGQEYNYSLSDITVVGHSLGAHIGGHIGKYNNGSLGVIVGLDPAGPFYFKGIRDARLTEDDAHYVQAIHTHALFLGVSYNIGHVDFWPNGGYSQNGCGLDIQCSHQNAYRYYAESITNNSFFARQCDSYDDFKKGKCKENSKSRIGTINIDTSAFGDFYLETNSEAPFGQGDVV